MAVRSIRTRPHADANETLFSKERASLLPLSYRLLLTTLFTEIRLFTRSSKSWVAFRFDSYLFSVFNVLCVESSAPWLPSVIAWTTQGFQGARATLVVASPFADEPTTQIVVDEDVMAELKLTMSKIRTVHGAASETRQSKHVKVSSTCDLDVRVNTDYVDIASQSTSPFAACYAP